MPTALGTLITQAQGRADMETDPNVGTSVWIAFINGSRQRLRRILVSVNPQQFLLSKTFTLAGSTYTYDLLANTPTFWKALSLDKVNGSQADQIEPVRRFMWAERSMVVNGRSYRVYGNTLEIRPASAAAGDYLLWYVEQPAIMADTVNDKLLLAEDMWSEFIVLEAAIKARKRQRRDTNDLVTELTELVKEMRVGAADNDAGEPDRVFDVQGDGLWLGIPRLPPA